jgi:excisionase family DNA binding protein
MRAMLTGGESSTRGSRAFDSPHESRRKTLPVLLTVDEAADLLRTTRRAIYAMIERRQLPGAVSGAESVASSEAVAGRRAHPALHILFAPDDARSAAKSDSGAGRPSGMA